MKSLQRTEEAAHEHVCILWKSAYRAVRGNIWTPRSVHEHTEPFGVGLIGSWTARGLNTSGHKGVDTANRRHLEPWRHQRAFVCTWSCAGRGGVSVLHWLQNTGSETNNNKSAHGIWHIPSPAGFCSEYIHMQSRQIDIEERTMSWCIMPCALDRNVLQLSSLVKQQQQQQQQQSL